jgi:hypothetical protein
MTQINTHHQQAGNKTSHYSYSLSEEPHTGIISIIELQKSITATHQLKSQGQVSLNTLKLQQGTTATHILESQKWALSAG